MVLRPLISTHQTAFLRFELDHGDARRRKKALQEICRLYRGGFQFNAENSHAVETTIDGLLLQNSQDRKVVRWGLNALARLGRRGVSDNPVRLTLKHYDGDPEITAAGIAALSSMFQGRLEEIDIFRNCDPSLRVLAALQNTDPRMLDLSNIKIDIDNADKEILKLALITVGLNRDIENLFHPRHSNGVIVKALGKHPDDIVVQYSVWAIIENRKLNLDDLGVNTHAIDNLPPNVQSKVMQLIAQREPDKERRHQVLLDGPFLPYPEAREGMAKGLQHVYYDGLEGITLDWSRQEAVDYVRTLLAQHFARFSNVCVLYEEEAINLFESEPQLREPLLLGAEGKPLYGKLKVRDERYGTRELFESLEDELMVALKGQLSPTASAMKVLVLSASPKDETRLRLDEEARDLKEKLRAIDNPQVRIVVAHEWAVRTDQIQEALFNEAPKVLHFSGHGNSGLLCFEDRNGQAAIVDSEALAELIGLHKESIECVVLSACYSEEVAKAVRAHIKWVIGCDGSIADDAAIAFSRAFYRALSNGQEYEKAFRFARNEISLHGMRNEADKYRLV